MSPVTNFETELIILSVRRHSSLLLEMQARRLEMCLADTGVGTTTEDGEQSNSG